MTNTTLTTLIDTINTRLAEENKPYTVKYELTNENNIFRDAIRVIPNDCTIDNILVCPVLYFDNKRTIDKWVQIIDHAYKTSEDIRKTHALHTKDRDFILSNIFTSIVDINNTEFLENKIYDTFLDFAVVYRIQNDKHSTCAVTKGTSSFAETNPSLCKKSNIS